MTGPGDVNRPGVTVRIKCGGGGMSYSSPRATLADATEAAGVFEANCVRATLGAPFVSFVTEYGAVRVRAERVTAIEVIHAHPRSDLHSGLTARTVSIGATR